MKKVLVLVFVLMVSVAFMTSVSAQPRKETPPQSAPTGPAPAPEKKAAPKVKTMSYNGDVTKVDAMAKTIVVKGKKGDMTFDVSMAKWKPYKDMAEVKEGDPVMVRYMEKEGKMMASSVTKGKPSGAKPLDVPKEPSKKPGPKPGQEGGAKPLDTPAAAPAKK